MLDDPLAIRVACGDVDLIRGAFEDAGCGFERFIDSSRLGRVLVHEHIFLMNAEYTLNYRPDFFDAATITNAAARLNELKASGIDTIIDLTVLGLGRYAPHLEKVGALTDLNIIVSTGAYTFDEVPGPFAFSGPGLMHGTPVAGPCRASDLYSNLDDSWPEENLAAPRGLLGATNRTWFTCCCVPC